MWEKDILILDQVPSIKYRTHRCDVWWYVLSGSLNWDILVFAKIDPSIAGAKQLQLESLIPGSGDRPVDLASTSAASVITPSSAHSVISVILPTIISNRLLPAIVATDWSIALVGVSIIPSVFLTAPTAPAETPEVREIDVARTPRVSITTSAPISIMFPFSLAIAISPSVSVAERS